MFRSWANRSQGDAVSQGGELQGRFRGLRACRDFRANNSMCGLEVDVGAQRKHHQKSLAEE